MNIEHWPLLSITMSNFKIPCRGINWQKSFLQSKKSVNSPEKQAWLHKLAWLVNRELPLRCVFCQFALFWCCLLLESLLMHLIEFFEVLTFEPTWLRFGMCEWEQSRLWLPKLGITKFVVTSSFSKPFGIWLLVLTLKSIFYSSKRKRFILRTNGY